MNGNGMNMTSNLLLIKNLRIRAQAAMSFTD